MKSVGVGSMLIGVILLLIASPVYAASGDDILGVWDNQEKDAKIEMHKCGEKYCGRIVWMKTPDYPEDSKDGIPGTPRLDHNNPDEGKRKTPILGLVIARDFIYAGNNTWTGGKVYDPKNGKTYSGKMTLVSPNRLDMRGFIGISLFGRTTTWTR
jgi:uncharacterized protein (DUF2147 family)